MKRSSLFAALIAFCLLVSLLCVFSVTAFAADPEGKSADGPVISYDLSYDQPTTAEDVIALVGVLLALFLTVALPGFYFILCIKALVSKRRYRKRILVVTIPLGVYILLWILTFCLLASS